MIRINGRERNCQSLAGRVAGAVMIVAWGVTGPAMAQPASAPFTPSTQGKKLLHYRGPDYEYMKDHTREMEEVAFDGLILGGALAFRDRVKPAELNAWADRMAAVPFKRYTDNFYLCYSVPGQDSAAFDWFDDLGWIVENWRVMAAAAKRAGFKGICFDSEYYEGLPLFGYFKMRHKDTKTLAEYQAQVRLQAGRMMQAVNEVFPDITILMLFGYSGTFNGVPQHPQSRQENYTLVAAFVDGLLSQCKDGASIHDMHEQCFSFRVPGAYARARAMMKDVLAERSQDPERYARYHRAGFSFWADCWENASQSRPFDLVDFERNYYTPQEFAYSLHHALAYSDKYVWMWPGVIDWWKRSARTVDAEWKEIRRPLPKEYLDTLAWAHEDAVARPPRDRRPNTFRNESAAKQEGFGDEETFADLWKTHTRVCALPDTWRFTTDPDEVGVREKWFGTAFDDSAWRALKIREFWELQGPSPYDGQAWYRLTWTPPELPRGKKAALAFGGVADEAEVFVNGRSLFASRFGENIRHRRFLVDVSDALKPGAANCIAVRVWNTGWCGGIWKSVLLVTENTVETPAGCGTATIPPRPSGAVSGSRFARQVWSVPKTSREQQVQAEITAGNLPEFLRKFVPVTVTATINSVPHTATFYVMPDYLAVGSNSDFVRFPMGPRTAQSIGDAFGCTMPTRKMVNDIYAAATVKLEPHPYSPRAYDIESVEVFNLSNTTIEQQRAAAGALLGSLVGGIKKDVVITGQLASRPGKVAIYGWHQLNGQPIQPLYLGHEITYMDYSHGIRLVRQIMLVDGGPRYIQDVLKDPQLCQLISDEGVVTDPRYQ